VLPYLSALENALAFKGALHNVQFSYHLNCVVYMYHGVGFYTAWLLPAAIVGLLVFLFGIFTMGLDYYG